MSTDAKTKLAEARPHTVSYSIMYACKSSLCKRGRGDLEHQALQTLDQEFITTLISSDTPTYWLIPEKQWLHPDLKDWGVVQKHKQTKILCKSFCI